MIDIYTDGASRGNPGLAAVGILFKEGENNTWEFSKIIGRTTNNVAEYTALIYALQEALTRRADVLRIHTDSELMYRQIMGIYRVKNENIKPLFGQVQNLLKGFKNVDLRYIPREQNQEADRLANLAIKKEQNKVVASPSHGGGEESPSSGG